MKVPFLDLKAQYNSIKNEVNPAIQNILDNTSFILGKSVAEFENNFAKALEVKHCSGVSSGTDGNHLVLWALGIKPGDEVIIPDDTFIATAWGATLCGATPVFVDCHPQSYNLDPAKIEKAITKKTKAIVAVNLYGQPADLDPINEIGKKHNLIVVEDCAQSHLAEYKHRKTGGLARAASFSFYPGKNLGAYGEGGAVTTNDDELGAKFKMMREHGSSQKYNHMMYGHNYRMEGIQGAVLNVKLKYLNGWTNERRRAAKKYNECLKDVEQIILPVEMEYAKHVYHLFVIQVKSTDKNDRSAGRNKLQKFLEDNGISTGLHYPIPLHVQPCFSSLGYKKGDFPVTEELAERGLSLPIFPELTDNQIEYVSEKMKEFFK
ncbi:MAG: DegT/DnrJ/EryC1/StrS family aminotransferase [Ignavibacteriaceae bacterium]|nr:DegT/DnrJ/EryC1/StrS family aminotransferase [Ignavibacteriaceae bacterium]